MPSKFLLDRRTCLRGLGASLALPLLESMGWAEPRAKEYKPPVRLGFMYMPHGVIVDTVLAQIAGELSQIAAPGARIAAARAQTVSDVQRHRGRAREPFRGAPHALELSTRLTARVPNPDRRGRIEQAGISADQIAANYVGGLSLACRRSSWPRCRKRTRKIRTG